MDRQRNLEAARQAVARYERNARNAEHLVAFWQERVALWQSRLDGARTRLAELETETAEAGPPAPAA